MGSNDATSKLGGNPYGNLLRLYLGSTNDSLLNQKGRRVVMDFNALGSLANYQTSGPVRVPLVTMHTIRDEEVPFWHEILYWLKARPAGGGSLLQIPIDSYGHCNFTKDRVLLGFGLMLLRATGERPSSIPNLLEGRHPHQPLIGRALEVRDQGV